MSNLETPSKDAVLEALRDAVKASLLAVTDTQRAAQEGAVHEEARPESDKDTRATEASYLARGLARRVQELRGVQSALAAMTPRVFSEEDAVALGALVRIERASGEVAWSFIAPRGGGMTVRVAEVDVRVITPSSPIGRALMGLYVGDEAEVTTPKGVRSLYVEAIA